MTRVVGPRNRNVRTPVSRLAAVCLAAGALAACPPRLRAASEPLIAQDFENVKPGSALPDGVWDNSGWAGASATLSIVDTGQPEYGRALQIDSQGFAQVVLGPLSVRRGVAYRVQAALRALGNTPVEIFVRRTGAPYTKLFGRRLNAHETWRRLDFTAKCAFDEPRALLMLLCRANTILWVDDVRVSVADAETALSPRPPPRKGNLLHNSSFELGLEGWMWRGDAEIDRKTAHSGRASLRWTGRGLLSSTWHEVGVRQRYTLSAWVRCEGGACRPRLSISNWIHMGGGKTEAARTFEVKPGRWQRLVLEWTAPFPAGVVAEKPAYYVNFVANAPAGAVLWVDDLDFRFGPPADYAPRARVELAIVSDEPYSVYTARTPVTLRVLATGPAPEQIRLLRLDEEDRVVAATPVQLYGAAAAVPLGPLPPGYWRFVTDSGLAADQVDEGELLVSVAPVMPDVPIDRWWLGAHIPASERAPAACRRLGMHWNRLHDTGHETKWDAVEPEQEKFVFDDASIARKRALGFGILGSLDGLPRWRMKTPDRRRRRSAMNHPDTDTAAWERYIRTTVGHWKNAIRCWEIMNEPNGCRIRTPIEPPARFYAHMLAAAVKAIRAVDPDAVIVGLGGASIGGNDVWLETVLATGAARGCDVLSYHGYGTGSWTTAVRPERLVERVNHWRALMKKHGRVLPLWDTETGICLASASRKYRMPGEAAPRQGAWLLPKMLATARAAGVARMFLYSAHEVTHAGSLGLNFLLDFNNQMKSAAVPIAVTESLLEGTRCLGLTRPEPQVVRVLFARGDRRIAVLWSARGSRTVEEPLLAAPNVQVLHCFGRPLEHRPSGLRVTVTERPIFVVAGPKSAAEGKRP